MTHAETSDSQLIVRAASGDTAAFGRLYERHLDAIYRYIYFRVSNARDAEDLTEQVFLKAWQALPDYEQQGTPFTSWLYRIAHNAVIDHYRRRDVREAVDPEEIFNWGGTEASSLEWVIAAEETERLADAIGQLPEEQQQVIILRFIEGLDHAAVADILEKSNGACRMIQYRALTTLSRLLTAEKQGA
jgi:RNA polymerase sigma-70 factor (ECF subfamily)